MIPSSVTALALLIVAIAPGYAFLRVSEQRSIRPQRSPLVETADLICVGAVGTAIAAIVIFGIGRAAPGLFLDLGPWAEGGSKYLSAHAWQALSSAGATMIASVAISAGLGGLSGKSRRGRIQPGSVWDEVFRPLHYAQPPFLAVELKDGRLIEGFASVFSTEESASRELALQAPLFMQNRDRKDRIRMQGRFVVISADQIHLIHGAYLSHIT
jgi:hypothetical protein